MTILTSNRIEGSGKGTEMGFPTVNFILDELPQGIEQGLYAITNSIGNGMSLISSYKGKYRIETHIVNPFDYRYGKKKINIKVGDSFTVNLLDKLRDPKKTCNIQKLISDDIALVKDYFSKAKTCLSCQLCYIQDHGYSNYTVDGSNIGCYANVFGECDYPHDGSDINVIYNSIRCNHMIDGDHWSLDVDGESLGPSDEWIKSMMRDVKINKIIG